MLISNLINLVRLDQCFSSVTGGNTGTLHYIDFSNLNASILKSVIGKTGDIPLADSFQKFCFETMSIIISITWEV